MGLICLPQVLIIFGENFPKKPRNGLLNIQTFSRAMTLDQLLNGFKDGVLIGADPLGTVYSAVKHDGPVTEAKSTFGGRGLHSGFKQQTTEYKVSRFAGAAAAGYANLRLRMAPQVLIGAYYGLRLLWNHSKKV
jgi:hypothetical protein